MDYANLAPCCSSIEQSKSAHFQDPRKTSNLAGMDKASNLQSIVLQSLEIVISMTLLYDPHSITKALFKNNQAYRLILNRKKLL